jgi:hypothetical protein
MSWIKTYLTLVIFLIGFGSSQADAAEARAHRGPIDGVPAGAAGDDAAGLTGADHRPTPTRPVHTSAQLDVLIETPPIQGDRPSVEFSTQLDSLVPALPSLIDTSPSATQRCCPSRWPATTARRLTWLQRFLF